RTLAGAAAAVGNIAPGLYLPQRRAGGEGSFAQAQPVSAPENNESVKHSESDDAQHRIVGVRLGSGLAIQHSRDHEGWCVNWLESCRSAITPPKKVRQLGSPCSLARFAGRWS